MHEEIANKSEVVNPDAYLTEAAIDALADLLIEVMEQDDDGCGSAKQG